LENIYEAEMLQTIAAFDEAIAAKHNIRRRLKTFTKLFILHVTAL